MRHVRIVMRIRAIVYGCAECRVLRSCEGGNVEPRMLEHVRCKHNRRRVELEARRNFARASVSTDRPAGATSAVFACLAPTKSPDIALHLLNHSVDVTDPESAPNTASGSVGSRISRQPIDCRHNLPWLTSLLHF